MYMTLHVRAIDLHNLRHVQNLRHMLIAHCHHMKSFIAKRLNSILINLRYLRFKLLKYKENNKNICNTFDHNFKNIPFYITPKNVLEVWLVKPMSHDIYKKVSTEWAHRAIGAYCTATPINRCGDESQPCYRGILHGARWNFGSPDRGLTQLAAQCLCYCAATQRNGKQTLCAMVNAKAKRYAHAIVYV